MRGGRVGTVVMAVVAALIVAAPAGAVVSESPTSSTWVTNGHVDALAQLGSRLYLGGLFSFVGPRTGAAALLDTSKAGYGAGATSLEAGFPVVDGPIDSVASDGSGGFYIGGSFTHVGGVAQANLAHVKADNSVDMGFRPSVNSNVFALRFSGTRVIAGGSFTTVDGSANSGLVSLLTNGTVDSAWQHSQAFGPHGQVYAIALSGTNIYAGGQFTEVFDGSGGTTGALSNVARFSLSDGNVDGSFHPPIAGAVNALQTNSISGTSALLIGGDFTSPKAYFDAVSTASGSDIPLGGYPDAPVHAIASDGTGDTWIGGEFAHVGGTSRGELAKYENASLDPFWNPDAIGGAVRTLEPVGSEIVFGGDFVSAVKGGTGLRLVEDRLHLAAVAASSDATSFHFAPLSAWNPGAGASVLALGQRSSSTTVLAAGVFTTADGLPRQDIAALDLPSGTGDLGFSHGNADTGLDSRVWALATNGTQLYAGGSFTKIDGSTSNSLADLNPTTGALVIPSAATGGTIQALAFSADGTKLYAGGPFLNFAGGGDRLTAFNAATEAVIPGGAPNPDNIVTRLLTSGSTVYVAGHFTKLGAETHPLLGAFSSSTGSVISSFAPLINGTGVTALAKSGSRLYIGGQFQQVDGAHHSEIAAVNATSGAVDNGWQAGVDGGVLGLAVLGNHLYAAGVFTHAGPTEQRFGLAALNLTNGALSPDWHPQLTGDASAIVVDAPPNSLGPGLTALAVGNTLYVGTGAQQIDGTIRPGLAAFSFAHPGSGAPKVLGSPWPGQRLACSVNGFGAGAESYSFTWLRDGKPRASGQTYTVAGSDLNHSLACRVTAVNPGGSTTGTSRSVKITHRPGGPKMKISRSARAAANGALTIKVTCPRGFTLCAGSLTLTLDHVKLGGGRFKLHGARSAKIHIRLSKSIRTKLAKQHTLHATATALAHDASNRFGTASVPFKLLAHKHR